MGSARYKFFIPYYISDRFSETILVDMTPAHFGWATTTLLIERFERAPHETTFEVQLDDPVETDFAPFQATIQQYLIDFSIDFEDITPI